MTFQKKIQNQQSSPLPPIRAVLLLPVGAPIIRPSFDWSPPIKLVKSLNNSQPVDRTLMAITIKDVAEKAGVARSTVSKVISDHASISDATKDRVRAVMRELNYYPNRLAQGFAQQKSYTLGLLMAIEEYTAFENPYSFEILCGIEQAAGQRHYNVALHNLLTISQEREHLQRVLTDKRVDGFILHSSPSVLPLLKMLRAHQVPYVLIGEPTFPGQHSWVDIDNESAGAQATQHLIEAGYQRIAFVGGAENDLITQNRLRGFQLAIDEGHLQAHAIQFQAQKTAAHGQLAWQAFGDSKPDAIVACDTFLAIGLMQQAQAQGISIPQQLGVIGFDNHPLSLVSQPELSVMDVGLFGLGREAADALFQQIAEPNRVSQKRLLSGKVIARASSVFD